jgi:FkbM family methyltransferase
LVFGPVRGIAVLGRRLLRLGQGRLVRARAGDRRHPVWLRFGSTDESAYFQVFGQGDYELEYVNDPEWIIDAGANVGFASLYFSRRFPAARILAIEPDPSNFEVLQRNIEPHPQIKAVRAALWSSSGSVRLVDPGLGEWGLRVDPTTEGALEPDAAAGDVLAITVPEAMALLGAERVDVLKVDIEGGEREVFGGSDSWIGLVDSVIIELHDSDLPGCSDAFYSAVPDFTVRSRQGENVYVARPREGEQRGEPTP